jgi:predicted nucleotidyltransferase
MNTPKTGIGQLVKAKREEILRIAAQHGAYNVRIFGSVARGEDGPGSDVATKDALHWYIRDRILKEAVPL